MFIEVKATSRQPIQNSAFKIQNSNKGKKFAYKERTKEKAENNS
jgi:hypothetical protein